MSKLNLQRYKIRILCLRVDLLWEKLKTHAKIHKVLKCFILISVAFFKNHEQYVEFYKIYTTILHTVFHDGLLFYKIKKGCEKIFSPLLLYLWYILFLTIYLVIFP